MKYRAGFSIVELMLALLIFSLAAGAVMSSLVQSSKLKYDSKINNAALLVAQSVLESYKNKEISTIPSSGYIDGTKDQDGYSFTFKTSFCSSSIPSCGDTATVCTVANVDNVREINVQVSYNGVEKECLELVLTNYSRE